MDSHEHTLDNNLTIEFEYEYEPGEAQITYYPDGSGYPGSDSQVTIHYAWIQLKDKSNELTDVNILPYIDTLDEIDLENIIYDIKLKLYEKD
jgi:hypothetical protein